MTTGNRDPHAEDDAFLSCAGANQEFFSRVRAAFFAARERSAAVRFFAAACAWRDKARCDAAERGSRCKVLLAARERAGDGFFSRKVAAFFKSRFACVRTLFDAAPFFGAASFTPARRDGGSVLLSRV